MKKLVKYYLAVLGLVGGINMANAQQSYNYNQFIKNPIPINTAYALISQQSAIDILTHNQWVGLEGAPKTLFLNGSTPLPQINGAVGVVLVQDKITVEKQTTFSAFFAKAVRLSAKSYLGLAVSGGVDSFTGNYSQLSSTDIVFRNDISQTAIVAGASLMLYDPEKFYIGISVPAFKLKKKNDRYDSPVVYFTGAYLQPLNDDMKLKPAVLVTYINKMPVTGNLSLILYLKNQFGLGAGYSTVKAVSGIVTYQFKSSLSVTYSYQSTSGDFSNGQGSTHEVGIGFRFGRSSGSPVL